MPLRNVEVIFDLKKTPGPCPAAQLRQYHIYGLYFETKNSINILNSVI